MDPGRARNQREQHNSRSALIALHPELRNRIYNECLPISEVFTNIHSTYNNTKPGILSVRRSIRNEIVSIYYGRNRFEAGCSRLYNMQGWITHMPEQAITSLRKITLETFLIYDWEQCENEDRTLHKFQATIDFDNIKLPCKLIHISGDPKCDRPAVAMETINKQMAFIESDFKKQKPMSGELLWMVLEMMQIFSYSGRRREEVSLAHSVEASDEGESVVREPNDEVGEEEVEGRRRRS